MDIKQDIEDYKKTKLEESLELLTQEQRDFFGRCFPKGVNTEDQYNTAIGLIERTLTKHGY